jgi:ABC-type sugar transport system ATPase subunit
LKSAGAGRGYDDVIPGLEPGIRTTLDRLVIYVTREILQVRRIADRVVIMEDGEKVADVEKHEMTGEELEHIIRDGGSHVAARIRPREQAG